MSSLRVRQDRTFGGINGGLTNVGTSLNISPDGQSNPLPAFSAPRIMAFILEPGTNNEEIVWATSATGGQTSGIPIIRGMEGTTPIAHVAGAPYKHGPTLLDFQPNPIQDVAWYRGSTNHPLDDEFNLGTLDSSWIRVDTAGTNLPIYTVGADVFSISHVNNSGGADNPGPAHALLKSLGGRTYPLTIEFCPRLFRQYATNYMMFGLLLADGATSTSRGVWMMPFGYTSIATSQRLSMRSFAALNGGQTDIASEGNWEAIGGPVFQRLVWSAANTFQQWYSVDGVSWMKFGGDLVTTLPGGLVPTYGGFAISNWQQNTPCMAAVEYFRVT